MADSGSSRGLLSAELGELFWVVGAVPGALLRWQVGLQLVDRNVLVNGVLGAALLGWLAGAPCSPASAPARCWLLWFVDHLQQLDAGYGASARRGPLGGGARVAGSHAWSWGWGPPGLATGSRNVGAPPDPIGVLIQPALEAVFDGTGELSAVWRHAALVAGDHGAVATDEEFLEVPGHIPGRLGLC